MIYQMLTLQRCAHRMLYEKTAVKGYVIRLGHLKLIAIVAVQWQSRSACVCVCMFSTHILSIRNVFAVVYYILYALKRTRAMDMNDYKYTISRSIAAGFDYTCFFSLFSVCDHCKTYEDISFV